MSAIKNYFSSRRMRPFGLHQTSERCFSSHIFDNVPEWLFRKRFMSQNKSELWPHTSGTLFYLSPRFAQKYCGKVWSLQNIVQCVHDTSSDLVFSHSASKIFVLPPILVRLVQPVSSTGVSSGRLRESALSASISGRCMLWSMRFDCIPLWSMPAPLPPTIITFAFQRDLPPFWNTAASLHRLIARSAGKKEKFSGSDQPEWGQNIIL